MIGFVPADEVSGSVIAVVVNPAETHPAVKLFEYA